MSGIKLEHGELTALMRMSDRRHVLNVSYGTGGAFLEGPQWALDGLSKLRELASAEEEVQPCPRCHGKGFLNPDGTPVNAFEESDYDPVIACPACEVAK